MHKIPDLHLAHPTLISLGSSSGTGFAYRSDLFFYLITAKHVLFDEEEKIRNSKITLTSPSIDMNDDSVINFQIDLEIAPYKFHKTCDIAVVQMSKIDEIKKDEIREYVKSTYLPGVERVTKNKLRTSFCSKVNTVLLEKVLISNDVYVSGYPVSLGIQRSKQFDNTKPLLRKGIIANIFKETQTIILDCPVYGGNSGGPVIQVVEDKDKRKLQIIGVVSQYIPFVQRWRNDRERLVHEEYLNSGYSVATAFDPVLELIKSLE